MHNKQSRQHQSFRRLGLAMLCGLAVMGLLGCDGPEVKKYTVPREKASRDFTRLESYSLPPGWTRLAKPVEFSVASFQAGAADKPVVITVSRLAGNAGGLVANLNRWRGKAGLQTLDEDQMAKDLLWLKVDGEKTPYVDLVNPKQTDANRILGVVAERGPVTWFFKLQGPAPQVDQQKAAFEAFVESIKFGGTGANDG
jgi:hypothetical protein